MEHVGEGLDVHQPMLDRDIEQSAKRKTVACRRICVEDSLLQMLIECAAHVAYISSNRINRGPVRGQVGRKTTAYGVDAEGKQPVKFRSEAPQSEDALTQQIRVERFEVSQIKNY